MGNTNSFLDQKKNKIVPAPTALDLGIMTQNQLIPTTNGMESNVAQPYYAGTVHASSMERLYATAENSIDL